MGTASAKKILFLLNTVGEGSGPLQRAVMLSREGYDMHVWSFLGKDKTISEEEYLSAIDKLRQRYEHTGVRLKNLDAVNFYKPSSYYRLFLEIKRHRFNVVFCHNNAMGSLGLFVSKLAGIRKVYKVELSSLGQRRLRERLLDFIAFGLADGIICISKSTSDSFTPFEDRLFGEKKRVIYNGINLEDSRNTVAGQFRGKYGLDPDTVLIANASRFHPVKDHDFLIKSFSRLYKICPDSKLVLAGRGELEGRIRDSVRNLGIEEAVIFTGHITRPEVYEMLTDCDIYAMTSRAEGLSEALLQAMSCGKPTVLTNIASFRETIDDGAEGFLVNEGDVESFAEKLHLLVTNKERRLQMGYSARSRVYKYFSIDQVIDKYKQLLGDR